MEPLLSPERVSALQGFLAGGLHTCEQNMDLLRDRAGRIAITTPEDMPALASIKREHDLNNEIRAYINALISFFPELQTK